MDVLVWAMISLVFSVQVSEELLQQIKETVLQKTVDGMKAEGVPYVGKVSLPHSLPCVYDCAQTFDLFSVCPVLC